MVLILGMAAVCAVSTAAAEVDAAQTAVDVKEGDEVVYTLTLGNVAEPVIGCDFSFYYDSSLFEVVSVADFTGETNSKKWKAMINTDLDGEVRGNWSILSGVDFSAERNFVTLTLKALGEGTGHISYFIRYMYDNNIFESDDKPQITEYKFTCSLTLNGDPVLEAAPPELNVVETQSTGYFVNSVSGDSKDADPEIPGTVVKKNAANSGSGTNVNNVDNNNGDSSGSGGSGAQNGDKSGSDDAKAEAQPMTTAEGDYVVATDAQGNVTATSDEAAAALTATGTENTSSGSPAVWIIIVLIVLAGGGAAAYFFTKKKSDTQQ